MRKRPFTPEQFKAIYSQVPRLCVDLIIHNDQGDILLIKRVSNGWEGQWHTPGGTVYLGETLQQTVRRIADEELGVKIKINKLLGPIEVLTEIQIRGFGQSVSFAFDCTIIKGEPRESEPGENPTFFKEVPENTILEQKEFLEKLHD